MCVCVCMCVCVISACAAGRVIQNAAGRPFRDVISMPPRANAKTLNTQLALLTAACRYWLCLPPLALLTAASI